MKHERIDIRPGDLIRVPDRATARWHRVVRVGRRRDGTRYITLRRSRIGRLLGLSPMQRLEWGHLKALGYGLKRERAADDRIEKAPVTWICPTHGEVSQDFCRIVDCAAGKAAAASR